MAIVDIKINGRKISKEVPDHTLLSDFLRDDLALTGTHVGCDTSQCGACIVHLNGNSVKSCTTLIADCDGSEITTIEGLAGNGKKIKKDIPDNLILSDFLREKLGLTGTHVGCDTSQCGACVVLLNGNSVKSCTALAADCNGS